MGAQNNLVFLRKVRSVYFKPQDPHTQKTTVEYLLGPRVRPDGAFNTYSVLRAEPRMHMASPTSIGIDPTTSEQMQYSVALLWDDQLQGKMSGKPCVQAISTEQGREKEAFLITYETYVQSRDKYQVVGLDFFTRPENGSPFIESEVRRLIMNNIKILGQGPFTPEGHSTDVHTGENIQDLISERPVVEGRLAHQ